MESKNFDIITDTELQVRGANDMLILGVGIQKCKHK